MSAPKLLGVTDGSGVAWVSTVDRKIQFAVTPDAQEIWGSIIRAVNNHDKLAEALQNMIKVYWPKNADGTYGDGLPEPIVIKEARAALQAAGVEDVP